MNKLAFIALQSKGFEDATINAILEVAEATGNALVAVEKVLGVYEAPPMPAKSTSHRSDEMEDRKFIRFDPFKDLVYYEVERRYSEKYFFKTEDLMNSADTLEQAQATGKSYYARDDEKYSKEFFYSKSYSGECYYDEWIGNTAKKRK